MVANPSAQPPAAPRAICRVGLGIVLDRAGDAPRVLISRRRTGPGAVLGGFWEFPGGKVEPGESLEQTIRRELLEEVDLPVEPIRPLRPIEFAYPHGRVRLEAMICRPIGDQPPRPLQVDQCRWVTALELATLAFPPANAPLLAELTRVMADPSSA